MRPFKKGDRVVSTRGLCIGQRGVIIGFSSAKHDFARVRFTRPSVTKTKNILNLEHIVPMYLRMDKGL